jgi:uncharacterized protein
MAGGLPDLVDCARLAEDTAVLERAYQLRELPRLEELLAQPQGVLNATFAFSTLPSGRPGASITVRAEPMLVCQRCLQGFAFPVQSSSRVEFADDEMAVAADTERELFVTRGGLVSLRQLAEEELLLALPIAPVCRTPLRCGNPPGLVIDPPEPERSDEMRRPFSGLQDLLKKR